MKLYVLAFGVHPDDVELSCSGTLINEVKKGNPAGVIDLTQGELGTRGTIETRKKERIENKKIGPKRVPESAGIETCDSPCRTGASPGESEEGARKRGY